MMIIVIVNMITITMIGWNVYFCERPRVLCVVGGVWGRMMILKNHDSYSYSEDPDQGISL